MKASKIFVMLKPNSFNFKDTKMLIKIHYNEHRKIVELTLFLIIILLNKNQVLLTFLLLYLN